MFLQCQLPILVFCFHLHYLQFVLSLLEFLRVNHRFFLISDFIASIDIFLFHFVLVYNR